jgi:hypothetical protein
MALIEGFFGRLFAGLPIWVWLLIVGGGLLLAFVILPRFTGKSGSSSSSATGTANDPNIDPNTGVPYNIESQINPATGLPAYYGVGNAGGTMPPVVSGGSPTGGGSPPIAGGGSGGLSGIEAFLTGNPKDKASGNSWFLVGEQQAPSLNTVNAIAQFFSIKPSDITYNPHNKGLADYQKGSGSTPLQPGTYVWVTESTVPKGWTPPPGSSTNTGAVSDAPTANNTANQQIVAAAAQKNQKAAVTTTPTHATAAPSRSVHPVSAESPYWPFTRQDRPNILPLPGRAYVRAPGVGGGTEIAS